MLWRRQASFLSCARWTVSWAKWVKGTGGTILGQYPWRCQAMKRTREGEGKWRRRRTGTRQWGRGSICRFHSLPRCFYLPLLHLSSAPTCQSAHQPLFLPCSLPHFFYVSIPDFILFYISACYQYFFYPSALSLCLYVAIPSCTPLSVCLHACLCLPACIQPHLLHISMFASFLCCQSHFFPSFWLPFVLFVSLSVWHS